MQRRVQNQHQESIRTIELEVLDPSYQGMTLGSVPFHYLDSSEYNRCLFDFYGSEYYRSIDYRPGSSTGKICSIEILYRSLDSVVKITATDLRVYAEKMMNFTPMRPHSKQRTRSEWNAGSTKP